MESTVALLLGSFYDPEVCRLRIVRVDAFGCMLRSLYVVYVLLVGVLVPFPFLVSACMSVPLLKVSLGHYGAFTIWC